MSGPAKPVRIGGLMRCCLETLAEYEGPEDEGTELTCRYEHIVRMVVRDGVWQWVGPGEERETPRTP